MSDLQTPPILKISIFVRHELLKVATAFSQHPTGVLHTMVSYKVSIIFFYSGMHKDIIADILFETCL